MEGHPNLLKIKKRYQSLGMSIYEIVSGFIERVSKSLLSLTFLFILFQVVFFWFPEKALSAIRTSAQTGNWSTASTWDCSCMPAGTDDAVISVGHTVTLTAATSITNLSINGTLSNGASTLTITGNYTNNGTHSGTGGTTLSGANTTIDGTGSITNTGTFTISIGSKSIPSTANLTFSGTVAVSGAITVTNNGTINSIATGGITGSAVGSTWVNAANSTLSIAGPLLATGTLTTTANPNTVNYNGTAAQTVKGTTYHHLTINKPGATATLGAATIVNGDLTITAGTLNTTTMALTVNGATNISGTLGITGATGAKTFAGPVTINPGGTWNNSINFAVTFRGGLTHNGATFTAGTGIQTFDTNNQTISGTSPISIPSITVTTITLTNNTDLTVGTALSGTGGLTQGVNSTLSLGGTSAITTLTATANPNTVIYTGAAAQTIKATTYHHVTINSAATAALGGNTTVNGDLTITAGTLALSTFTLTLKGNYTNNGTFTAGTGSVIIGGTVQQTLSGTMTGTSAFNSLTITNNSGIDPVTSPSVIFASSATATTATITTPSVKVQFSAGSTYTFININFNGQATTTRVQFRSSVPGTWWYLVVTGTQTVLNTNPQDSNASGGNVINGSDSSNVDGGNNVNWNLPASTIVRDGTNPGNVTIGPGEGLTDLDSFSVFTTIGPGDTITGVEVSLSAGSSGGLSEIRITSDDGLTTYFTPVINPAGDTISFSGGTPISVTTTATQYKVRIKPKDHLSMPPTPGSPYAVTGTVTSIICTNPKVYDDTNSATITIDNQSPSNATWGTIIAGNAQILLNWTNPGTDYSGAVILRNAGSPVTDTPVEGVTYTGGNTIGSSTVVFAGNSITYTDTGLSNGTNYYYKIFAYDIYKNYATGSGTGPHIPTIAGDTTAPATVNDLTIAATYSRGFKLTWISPGDDDNTGTAALYDFRYADAVEYPAVITPAYLDAVYPWASLMQAQGEPTPAIAGTSQNFSISRDVTGEKMTPNTLYYIGMKTLDEVLNTSDISNPVVAGHTAMKYGYNLISLPNDASTGGLNTVDDIFNDDICPTCGATGYVYMYSWQPAGLDNTDGSFNGSWVYVDPASTIMASMSNGSGYFLYSFNMNNTIVDEKNLSEVALVSQYTANWVGINLSNVYGRYMIGSPYLKNANFSNIKVCKNAVGFDPSQPTTGNPCSGTVAGTTFVSFQTAADSGWLSASILYYANSSTYTPEYCSTVLGCNAKLRPWWGHWIYLLDNIDSYYIAIPKP